MAMALIEKECSKIDFYAKDATGNPDTGCNLRIWPVDAYNAKTGATSTSNRAIHLGKATTRDDDDPFPGGPLYFNELVVKDDINLGTALHELFHVLGRPHEHQRPNRDEYIDIKWNQITSDMDYAFEKCDDDQNPWHKNLALMSSGIRSRQIWITRLRNAMTTKIL